MANLSEDSIRDDYLAGRGAASQVAIDQAWQGLLGQGEKAIPGAPAQPTEQSAETTSAPPEQNPATMALPIGKRIMSAVGSFAYGLVKPFVEGPSFMDQVKAHEERVGQMIQQRQAETGRPVTPQEAAQIRLSIPIMETPAASLALGFAGGGIAKMHRTPDFGLDKEGAVARPLADRLAEHLNQVAPAPESKPVETAGKPPEISEPSAPQRDILTLGDPLAPAVTIKPTAQNAAQAEVTLGRMGAEGEPTRVSGEGIPEPSIMSSETIHDYLAGARVDNPIKINLARIGSGDDIADALAQVSKTIPEQAVQPNDATIYAADALGLTPEHFLSGYQGSQLNAAETTAMRFMLDSSAEQLIRYAQAAREPLAAPETQAQFLKAFTVHRSLQQYFENARAEAGRTLQSWQIMSGQRANYTRAIGDLIKQTDAGGDLSQLADQIADMDNPLHVNRLVARSMEGTGRDRLLTIMYNIRLSSPTTIVKKLTSDVGMAMWNVATRGIAERFGSSGQVIPGETGALIGGYVNSLTDAIRAGGKALKAGESQFWREYGTMDALDVTGNLSSAAAVDRRFRLSALANGIRADVPLDQPTQGMFQYIRSALPTSWIAGADDFAKVWQYRANLRALAWREAGGDETEFQRLLAAPPQSLHQQAFNEALKYTFQEPLTGIAATLRDAADSFNIPVPGSQYEIPVGRVVMPFVKVPANIARMAYRSSPLAYVFRSPAVRQALANPGAERDILLAQMGLGTVVSLGVLGLSLNGNMTGKGPKDPGLRREWEEAGNRPYSLQIPGARPIQYNWFEPMGMVSSAIADTHNIMKFAKDEDSERAALSLVFGIGQAMLSKTYFQGISDFLDALDNPDQDAQHYTSNLVASFVPQGVQRIANATDEWYRAHYDTLDAIEANLPVVRESLPVSRTLWGDPIPTREAYLPFMSGHLASIVSPASLGMNPENVEPISRWIWDNREAFPHEEQTQKGIQKLSRTQSYSGGKGIAAQVQLTPQEYDRLQVLAGNELKDPRSGLGAKDYLNSLVEGTNPSPAEQKSWDEASPAARALMVQSVIFKYRRAAKEQIRQEFPDVDQAVQAGWNTRAQQMTAPP